VLLKTGLWRIPSYLNCGNRSSTDKSMSLMSRSSKGSPKRNEDTFELGLRLLSIHSCEKLPMGKASERRPGHLNVIKIFHYLGYNRIVFI
jgi:hypothetical protein